jgi:hypothetical protein
MTAAPTVNPKMEVPSKAPSLPRQHQTLKINTNRDHNNDHHLIGAAWFADLQSVSWSIMKSAELFCMWCWFCVTDAFFFGIRFLF